MQASILQAPLSGPVIPRGGGLLHFQRPLYLIQIVMNVVRRFGEVPCALNTTATRS